MPDPTPRSLILDLLSTLGAGTMPVAALVEAGALFGIPGGSTRVALTRLCARGLVERDERGHYRLGATAAPVQGRIRGWRGRSQRVASWQGDWIGVQRPPASDRARRRGDRALRFLGLARLAPGLHLRPSNLHEPLPEVRSELRALGLEADALVCTVRDLAPDDERRARALWDVEALALGYRHALRQLEESSLRLPTLPTREAMVESFRVGGGVLQQLVLDPLLPDEIHPSGEREALFDAMRRYDRLGRRCWADFLESFGVPHLRAPLDTRMGDDALRLRA